MNITEDLLTADEFAQQMGFTRRTAERLHAERKGPPRIKIGRRIYYRKQAVRDWLMANEKSEVRAL